MEKETFLEMQKVFSTSYLVYYHPRDMSEKVGFLILIRASILEAVEFETQKFSESHFYQYTALSFKEDRSKKFIFANCYLTDNIASQEMQEIYVRRIICMLQGKAKSLNATSIFICGSMSIKPLSKIYNFMQEQSYISCQKVVNAGTEPATRILVTTREKETCDYIWLKSKELEPLKNRLPFSIKEVIPDALILSDHIPLVNTFRWKK